MVDANQGSNSPKKLILFTIKNVATCQTCIQQRGARYPTWRVTLAVTVTGSLPPHAALPCLENDAYSPKEPI
jgi:hypothetical protein